MSLLYAVGYFVPVRVAAWVVLAVVLAGLALAIALRLLLPVPDGSRRGSLWSALRPAAVDLAVLGVGVVVALVLLAPMLRLGYPSTIAYSNNDGWSYAGLVDWLHDTAIRTKAVPSLAEPLNAIPYSQLRDGFGVGFELIATMTRTLLGREPYEVVNAVNALGAVAAVCGWAFLWKSLRGHLSVRTALFATGGVASPLLIMAYSENFAPHFFSLALWPFAVGAAMQFVDATDLRHLVVGAFGILGVLGTYPALMPWLILALVAVALTASPKAAPDADAVPDIDSPPASGPSWLVRQARASGRAFAALAVLGVAVAVLGPYQAKQAWIFATVHDAASGGQYPMFPNEAYLGFGLGATSHYPFIGGSPFAWSSVAGTVIVGSTLVAGLMIALIAGRRLSRRVAAVLLAVALTSLVVFVRFVSLPTAEGYGLFKSLVTGGALTGGLIMLLLLAHADELRGRWPWIAGAACLGVWVPISAFLVEQSYRGGSGFRAVDIQLGRELTKLPTGSTLLVDGAAEEPGSFQIRMMTAYLGTAMAHLDVQGLATTSSYIAPGGGPGFEPPKAWRYVVTTKTPRPNAPDRRLLWANARYVLTEAPTVDVTPYGKGWLAGESDAEGPFSWVTGPVELVVSNRGAAPRTVRLRVLARSYRAPRPVRLVATSIDRLAEAPAPPPTAVPTTGLTPLTLTVEVPAGGTKVVTLDLPTETRPASGADPRPVAVRVQDVTVRAA